MSLTSVELNYLIWRYLQESGFDLAAYAFSKDSACLEYEHAKNKLIPAIEPGCLINLVQKGILYTFLKDAEEGKESRLNLLDAILKDKADFDTDQGSVLVKSPDADQTTNNDQKSAHDSQDVNMADTGECLDHSDGTSCSPEGDVNGIDLPFQTDILRSFITLSPSLVSDWHNSTDVFALGNENSTAVIYALGHNGIAETVTLNHPPIVVDDVHVPNPISVVSWSPQGSMVLTAGVGGEIRAWAPDGRLKNIVNSVAVSEHAPATIQSLVWNTSGSLVLSINIHNSVSVWEGSTLTLLSELHGIEEAITVDSHACWVSDSKFAMTTRKNSIQIFSLNVALPYGENLLAVGQLLGHANTITNICFSPISKLLASASDVDYVIKVWNSSSTQDALELNAVAEKLPNLSYHTSPIIALTWLSHSGDVQGNELLSVSMEGSVNIWDAFTGDAIVSANVFKNPDNFKFSEENDINISTKNSLVFAAAVSPNSKFLAIGDDSGNVSVWDIHPAKYKNTKEFLRCLGIFAAVEKDANIGSSEIGICDLVWDSKNHFITVSYKGRESAILKWEKN
ncbi:hypothetical protein JCM33374_g6340 [Metschnikowia sp. JCM 33374]|nr:hypothetical protein JCM33374_g6340 [Metschnikowia sp. JCM 33374]